MCPQFLLESLETAEGMAAMYEAITGRVTTEEDVAKFQAMLDEAGEPEA